MYVILVGGGNVGLQLAKRLNAAGNEVLLIEKDSQQSERLRHILGDENVMVGDGCEMATQKVSGFGRADVVVAVTGEDEDNMVVCQMAKSVWNVERVLARVNDPDHEELFRKTGIDETVSATSIIYSLLEQQISPDTLLPVGALARGNYEIVEIELSSRSPVAGKSLRELELPPKTNVIWVLRGEQGHGVTGDTRFEAGDMVVALVPREHAESLRMLMAPIRH
ncbi:MAG: TrkA family potassium uptake protein [Armatimonadetes bacterium]|nr:TrkA family potassium uptake protein [Armatimonadota bacterium]